MEHLRKFKVTFYLDTNKRTSQKTFDLDDYEELQDLINDVQELLTCIENEEVLECL